MSLSLVNNSALNNRGYPISKLPLEVSRAMHREINSYDLDVGDCFTFACGYDWTTPKTIIVILRITNLNRDGTYSYNFYAWQHY